MYALAYHLWRVLDRIRKSKACGVRVCFRRCNSDNVKLEWVDGWTNGWLTLSTGNAKLLQHILYWHRWCSVCGTCACVSVCSSLAYCRKCKSVLLLLFSFRSLSVYSVPHSVSASFTTLRFDDDDFLHLFVLFYCWSCIANATMSMLIGFPLSSFRLPWHVHTLHHHHHFICLLFLCVKLNVAYLHSPFGIRINKYINKERAKARSFAFLGGGFAIRRRSLKRVERQLHILMCYEMGKKSWGKLEPFHTDLSSWYWAFGIRFPLDSC